METSNQKNDNRSIKTTLMSMNPGSKNLVLLIAKSKNVGYESLGADQHDNELVKFTYSVAQQKEVDSIRTFIKFFDGLVTELQSVLEPIFNILKDELVTLSKDLKTNTASKTAQ